RRAGVRRKCPAPRRLHARSLNSRARRRILPQKPKREEIMREFVEADRVLHETAETGRIPGVVAMAATRDGPVYEGAFGKRALPSGADMTTDTVFWIASMTKAITSTAAMQLVERGQLQLDSPIKEVLPELASPKVLEGFDASGEPKLRPARRDVTLRHLLTHT